MELLSDLRYPLKAVIGEHDYYLDLGEYWSELFGDQYYSLDHKGIHFVVLNSILTCDQWTFEHWKRTSPENARAYRWRRVNTDLPRRGWP